MFDQSIGDQFTHHEGGQPQGKEYLVAFNVARLDPALQLRFLQRINLSKEFFKLTAISAGAVVLPVPGLCYRLQRALI
jgi:hypothetical protein